MQATVDVIQEPAAAGGFRPATGADLERIVVLDRAGQPLPVADAGPAHRTLAHPNGYVAHFERNFLRPELGDAVFKVIHKINQTPQLLTYVPVLIDSRGNVREAPAEAFDVPLGGLAEPTTRFIDQLRRECEQLCLQRERLEQETQAGQKQLETAARNEQRSAAIVEALQRQCTENERRSAQLMQQCSALEASLLDQQGLQQQQERTAIALQNEVGQLQAALAISQQQVEEGQQARDALATELQAAQSALQSTRGENRTLARRLDSLSCDLAQQQERSTKAQAEAEKRAQAVVQLRQELADLGVESERLKQERAASDERSAELAAQLELVTSEASELAEELKLRDSLPGRMSEICLGLQRRLEESGNAESTWAELLALMRGTQEECRLREQQLQRQIMKLQAEGVEQARRLCDLLAAVTDYNQAGCWHRLCNTLELPQPSWTIATSTGQSA
jgi:hypothetical protein